MKNIAKVCAFLMVLAIASSCNKRGMGCPDAFKIEATSIQVIKCIIK